jgi:ATP adenylyltransferase
MIIQKLPFSKLPRPVIARLPKMTTFTIPQNLPERVSYTFKCAEEQKALFFTDSEVAVIKLNGLPVRRFPHPLILSSANPPQFQLRYAPTLKKKPKDSLTPSSSSAKKSNPFLEIPPPLFITTIGESHNLVLNKFALVSDHVILSTKTYKPQLQPLEEEDIAASYALLRAYKSQGQSLYGFYNCGTHSGASQPHRHVQFMPITNMRRGLSEDQDWEPLIAGMHSDSVKARLPFTYFTAPIRDGMQGKELHRAYLALYEVAKHTVKQYIAGHPDEAESLWDDSLEKEGMCPFSYNLGMTEDIMVIVPRRAEGCQLRTANTQEECTEGIVQLNGTISAGTLLCKDEKEWDALRNREESLRELLEQVGLPQKEFFGEMTIGRA